MQVSGRLPELAVNFSNLKYKSLMRIIDTAIPKLGDDPSDSRSSAPQVQRAEAVKLPLSANAFSGPKREEYVVEEDDDKASAQGTEGDDVFHDAEGGDRLVSTL